MKKMKNKNNVRRSITATFFALIMALGIFAMVSPVQANGGGVLYAGGSDPGYVYKYTGGTSWDVISSDLGYAVLDLVEYDGHLYAGIRSSSSSPSVGQVYRYDGGTTWTLVGDNMDDQVCSLAVYGGNLYAGTGRGDMNLYKYEGGTTWTRVVHYTPWAGTRALHVSHGYLLMGGLGYDRFGRWDGTTFYADLHGGGSCIWDYEDYDGNVYASAWQGRMWQSSDAISWSVLLGYYDGGMWELEEFRSKLYMSYGNGELRASNVPDRGALVYTAPDGIISMTTDGDNNLYFGTGGEAGYYTQTTGTASVYKYDGTTVALISGADEMVTGVQVLYIPAQGDCCACPGGITGVPCVCIQTGDRNTCEIDNHGIWVGENGCDMDTNEPCTDYYCEDGACIPEFSTIAIPVASILGLLFFFNHRKRKKEQ